MDQVERGVQRRKRTLDYAEETGNAVKAYRSQWREQIAATHPRA